MPPAMELSIAKTGIHLNPHTPRPTLFLSATSSVASLNPAKPCHNFPIFPKLSSSSRQFSILPAILRRFSVSASAVSTVAEQERLPADLEVSETQEPSSRVRLSVHVPPVVCDDCYDRVIRKFMKQAKVPGFRPGKMVPESILVSYVGKQNVRKATIESILKRTLPHAMSSVTGRALKDSIRIGTKFSEMEESYASLNSLRYDIIVDVAPEVKWNPENGYKNLKIIVEIDGNINAQKASEQELRRRHKSLGAMRIVTDRGLQVGDVVVLDISATTIGKDELEVEKIPSAESKGFHFDTEDSDNLLPGFLNSIIGIQRGETKSFPLVFPKSWKQENLRGVHAQFTVSSLLF